MCRVSVVFEASTHRLSRRRLLDYYRLRFCSRTPLSRSRPPNARWLLGTALHRSRRDRPVHPNRWAGRFSLDTRHGIAASKTERRGRSGNCGHRRRMSRNGAKMSANRIKCPKKANGTNRISPFHARHAIINPIAQRIDSYRLRLLPAQPYRPT